MDIPNVSKVPVISNPFEIISDRLVKIENILEGIRRTLPSEEVPPVYYGQVETAKMLHCSVVTIISYRKKGWLVAHRLGSKIFYTKADVEAAVQKIAVEKYKRV